MGFEIKDGVLVKYIDDGTKEIVIPDNVTSIESCAFKDCKSIVSVTITENVREIGQRAFQGCSNLRELLFINGSVFIDESAFYKCGNIKSIIIPVDFIGADKQSFLCHHTDFAGIKIIGKNISMELYGGNNLNSSEEEKELLIGVICAEYDRKEQIFNKIRDISYKAPCAEILAFEYGNETAKAYIRDDVVSFIGSCIYVGNIALLRKYLSEGYVTSENIDKFINFAIKMKRAEIRLILFNYKNKHLGFADNSDSLMLE